MATAGSATGGIAGGLGKWGAGALGLLLKPVIVGLVAGLASSFGIGAFINKVFDAPTSVLENKPWMANIRGVGKAMQDMSNPLNWERFTGIWHDLFNNDPRDKAFGKKWMNELYNRKDPEAKKTASDTERIRIATEKMAEGVLWGNNGWRGQAYLGSWGARAAHGRALAPTGAAG
jgi:hypothetical protein